MADNTFDPATTVINDIKGDYALDPTHTRLGFSTRHAMVTTVRGAVQGLRRRGRRRHRRPGRQQGRRSTIQAASVDTGVADRDGHLRSGDFFDVETYPEITFVSTDVERDGDDWAITGDLTIKDVTKPITIDFESTGSAKDPFGNLRDRLRGRGLPEPQGLGPDLERRARDRRRPGVRQDQARVRRLRHRRSDPPPSRRDDSARAPLPRRLGPSRRSPSRRHLRACADRRNSCARAPARRLMRAMDDLDLPDGLTSRPLTMDDAHAVYEVMAPPGAARHRQGRDRGGRHRRRLVRGPASTSAAQTVGVFDGDRLVAYAEVASVRPRRRGRPPGRTAAAGIGTTLAGWMQRHRARAAAAP